MSSKEEMDELISRADEIAKGMMMGFSVAIHGCGSKIRVIDAVFEVLRQIAAPGDKFVRIKGYDENFPLVRSLSIALQGHTKKTNIRLLSDVLKAVDKLPKTARMFVMIDSIDGNPLRGHQEFLSELAKRPNVYLCASVDHCKVALMWSPIQQSRFRWIWIKASTYHPYTNEVKDLVPYWRDVIEGKTDAASRSIQVLNSLTGSHSELVKVLAEMQMAIIAKKTKKNDENKDPNEVAQVRAEDLLRRCKKLMIADNQQKMRSLLQELIDHRLVLNSKDKDNGNELFWLPFDRDRLEQFAHGNLK
jgi:hypothetical protein